MKYYLLIEPRNKNRDKENAILYTKDKHWLYLYIKNNYISFNDRPLNFIHSSFTDPLNEPGHHRPIIMVFDE